MDRRKNQDRFWTLLRGLCLFNIYHLPLFFMKPRDYPACLFVCLFRSIPTLCRRPLHPPLCPACPCLCTPAVMDGCRPVTQPALLHRAAAPWWQRRYWRPLIRCRRPRRSSVLIITVRSSLEYIWRSQVQLQV